MAPRPEPVQPRVVRPGPGDPVAKTLAMRQAEQRAQLAATEERATAAVQARLADMQRASAELAERVARCRRLRTEDRCPGRCVITGLQRSELLEARGTGRLRRR